MSERGSDDLPVESSFFGEKSELGPTHDEPSERATPEPATRPRYAIGGELGRGGMGRVHAAFDPVLGREVALKQARDDDPSSEARLISEARITARLDHPGIVPVFDAGHDASGRPFYAMRVVRGQSLADVVAKAPPGRERLALLRPLLSAIEAVAHAHGREIVHRDLSPTNVRIDAHGVVLVMDWGLAASFDEARRGGTTCGTAGYRAPELELGRASGPAADVFSLGALLHFALTGHAPTPAPLPRWVPAELRSIVAHARAPNAHDRYEDASALEADVAAFLDGRPVSAHVDRLRDKVARRVRKSPLAAAGVTITALVVGVIVTALALRAIEAERRAEEERTLAQRALTDLLVTRAEEAVLRDDRTAAEDNARRALALGPSPEARGVLAAFAALDEVPIETRTTDGACKTLDATRDARVCVEGATLRLEGSAPWRIEGLRGRVAAAHILAGPVVAVALDVGGPTHELHLYHGPGVPQDRSVPIGGGVPLVDAGALDDRGRPTWLAVATPTRIDLVPTEGAPSVITPCDGDALVRAVAVSPRRTERGGANVFATCSDDTLVTVVDGVVATRVRSRDVELALRGSSVAAWVGERIVLGTVEGRIGLVDPGTGRVTSSTEVPVGPVRHVAVTPDLEHTLVAGELGAALWRLREGAWLAVEPGRGLDVRTDGETLLSFGTGSVRAWTTRANAPIHRHTSPAGLSAVAITPSGLVAIGAGHGVVTLVDPATGAFTTLPGARRAVKSLAFSPDGRRLAVGSASDHGLELFDVATRAPEPGPWDDVGSVRRVAFVGDELYAFRFGANVDVFAIDRSVRVDRPPPGFRLCLDVAAPSSGERLWALGDDGRLVSIDAHGPREVATVEGPRAVASSGDGRVLVVASERGLEVRDGRTGAVEHTLASEGAAIEELALSPSGDHVAIGRRDGTLELVAGTDGARLLRLRGHRQRIAGLTFSADGRHLVTTSWDGVARWLELAPSGSPGSLRP